MDLPYLILSDTKGNIFEACEYSMTGMSLNYSKLPDESNLIELPYGSNLYMLPDRTAIGYDIKKKEFTQIKNYHDMQVFPVASFMAPAYLQILRSAFLNQNHSQKLSLYSYTACGWKNNKFYVSGIRIDNDIRQDLQNVDLKLIEKKAGNIHKKYPNNRLVTHLIENCVFCYGCPAARNFVLERWECPVPTSTGCNSRCIGCISKQPDDTGVIASQDRISFIPTVKEIIEFTIPHLENVENSVISFGQGCEGEPLLVGDIIEESIIEIRKKTKKGIININTNGSRPEVVEKLCKAGLDSIRVSINSLQENFYNAYYKPFDYSFNDVIDTLKIIKKFKRWASINYLIFPGFTDHPEEIQCLKNLINKVGINMIQTRNLNIDPDWYIEELKINNIQDDSIGIINWVELLKNKFPFIKLGYFNPPLEEMKKYIP